MLPDLLWPRIYKPPRRALFSEVKKEAGTIGALGAYDMAGGVVATKMEH
jgi:hypothetical protein